MEDLGELGFWLAVGIALAAWILSSGQKAREKERQKQETLRALLTAEGKSTTEILAYMRERDAAEQAERDRDRQWEKTWGRRVFAVSWRWRRASFRSWSASGPSTGPATRRSPGQLRSSCLSHSRWAPSSPSSSTS